MTALDMRHAKAKAVRQSAVRAVQATKPSRRSGSIPAQPLQRDIVRPDRPASRKQRALFVVPSAVTAPRVLTRTGEWTIEKSRVKDVRHENEAIELARSLRTARPQRAAQKVTNKKAHARTIVAPVAAEASVLRSVVGVVAVMLMAVLAGIVTVAMFNLAPEAGASIVVQAGDSLTSIASAMGVDVATSQIVSDILALNAIDGATIYAGQELILPKY